LVDIVGNIFYGNDDDWIWIIDLGSLLHFFAGYFNGSGFISKNDLKLILTSIGQNFNACSLWDSPFSCNIGNSYLKEKMIKITKIRSSENVELFFCVVNFYCLILSVMNFILVVIFDNLT
jgi:hypothetical protein